MDGAPSHYGSSAAGTRRFRREHFAPASAFSPPESDLEHQLATLWEAVLNIEGLGIDDDFFEVGGESFAAVTLFTEMERFLGEMPLLSTLLDYPTIRRLAAFLEQAGAAAGGGLVIPLRTQGRRLSLFSAHAAHGNVLFVRKLLPFLGDEQPLYAIRARGLREGEAAHCTFEVMAADYVEEIRRVQPEGPYVLTGHCIGGIIAFEMAQRLKALGQDVAAIVMIDPEYHPNAVPWLYWRDPGALQVRLLLTILRPLWFARRWLRRIRDGLAGRPVVERTTETGNNRRRQNAVIAGLGAALRAYRPKRHVGRVVILCSAERRGYLANAAIGWRSLAPDVEFIEIGGSHDEVFFDALPAVGKTLEGILARFEPASPPPPQRVAAE
jgi:pimeloyl-ACP methyl ester carboxylesterase